MANLLPTNTKKTIRKEYRFRFLIVSSVMLAALIGSALLLLLPGYTLSSLRGDIASDQLAFEKNKSTSLKEEEENNRIILGVNSKLRLLSVQKDGGPSAYDTLNRIIEIKNSDIKISSFFFGKNADNTSLSLSGVAATRSTLLDFINTLKAEKDFISVDLPISNFVEQRDIDFSIKIIVGTIIAPRNKKNENE